jgi:LysM repeat protein
VTEEEHKEFSEQEVQQRFDAIGKDLVEAGLYAEAVEAYKQLIRDYPASRWAANAYLGIAHCYHAMGQEEEELAALEDIIAQFPDHVVAKRARGAIAALRERRSGEGPAGSDLHAAVRRLTRQVERMREGERHRTWLGAAVYVVLVVFVVFAVKSSGRSPSRAAQDLAKRVTALESALQALSSGPPTKAAPKAAAPAVTVIPVTPPEPARPSQPGPGAKAPPAVSPKGGASGAGAAPPVRQPAAPSATKVPAPASKAPRTVTKPPRPVAKAPAAPAAPQAASIYTIKAGDSLWTVARSQLGDGRRVDEIARLNGLKPPYKLKVGAKIKVPARK